MDKVQIGGVKIIGDLLQVSSFCSKKDMHMQNALCGELAKREINIQYLAKNRGDNQETVLTFCVEGSCMEQLNDIFSESPFNIFENRTISPAALVTFYPRCDKQELLGAILMMWGLKDLPLHGMATSLSAVSCVTDESRIDDVLSAINEHMILPPNHAPFMRETKVIQTALKVNS